MILESVKFYISCKQTSVFSSPNCTIYNLALKHNLSGFPITTLLSSYSAALGITQEHINLNEGQELGEIKELIH